MTGRGVSARPANGPRIAAGARRGDSKTQVSPGSKRNPLTRRMLFAALLVCCAPLATAQTVTVSQPNFNDGNIRLYIANVRDSGFRTYMNAAGEDREEGKNPVHFFGTTVSCDRFDWLEGETTFSIEVYTLPDPEIFDCPVDSCAPCPGFKDAPNAMHEVTKQWCLSMPEETFTDGACLNGGGSGPWIRIGDVTVDEDAGEAQFEVSLNTNSRYDISIDYTTADGTALAGSDYTAASGTLTIDSGSRTGTISVPVLDDEIDEPDESFTVTLSGATNATIADSQGAATITDNDEPPPATPSLGIDDISIDEDEENARFTVTLSNAFNQPVTVDYATTDGTAEAGSDYTGYGTPPPAVRSPSTIGTGSGSSYRPSRFPGTR